MWAEIAGRMGCAVLVQRLGASIQFGFIVACMQPSGVRYQAIICIVSVIRAVSVARRAWLTWRTGTKYAISESMGSDFGWVGRSKGHLSRPA